MSKLKRKRILTVPEAEKRLDFLEIQVTKMQERVGLLDQQAETEVDAEMRLALTKEKNGLIQHAVQYIKEIQAIEMGLLLVQAMSKGFKAPVN